MQRTALVTGGTGGLGKAVTSALLAAGWQVVVPWRGGSAPASDAPGLQLVQADLFEADAVGECVRRATADPDRPLAAVVNLVGGFAMGGRVHQTPIEDFEAQLRLNLRPTYLVTQAALPHLLAAGGGSVVCVSSQSIRRPYPGAAGYLTAKTALLGLVDALHAEYANQGVRVNAVLPGIIDTPANRASMPDSDRALWVAPEKIAQTIAFLCGDESGAVRGSHINV